MELTNEQYAEYDAIVARTYGMLAETFHGTNLMKVKYTKGVMSDYLLKIATSFSEISNKKVQVNTNIFTYIKLRKYYKNIRFTLRAQKDLHEMMLDFCEKTKTDSIKINEIYETYYKI